MLPQKWAIPSCKESEYHYNYYRVSGVCLSVSGVLSDCSVPGVAGVLMTAVFLVCDCRTVVSLVSSVTVVSSVSLVPSVTVVFPVSLVTVVSLVSLVSSVTAVSPVFQ